MVRYLALLSVLTALSIHGMAGAQEGPTLFVQPATQTVAVGETFEVDLMVANVTTPDGLGGYTLAVAYDPDVIHGLAITDSGFVRSGGGQVICPSSGIDNDAGNLAHLCFTIPLIPEPGPTASEPQALVRITFEAVGEGRSDLDIGESSITDPRGNLLAASRTNGEVVVQAIGGDLEPPTVDPDSVPTLGLPDSGGASEGSDRTALVLTFTFAGIGGVVLLVALLYFRVRRRSA